MPTTVPGFLLVAGMLMLVGSLFTGGVSLGPVKLPALKGWSRVALGLLGITCLAVSTSLYVGNQINVLWAPPTDAIKAAVAR